MMDASEFLMRFPEEDFVPDGGEMTPITDTERFFMDIKFNLPTSAKVRIKQVQSHLNRVGLYGNQSLRSIQENYTSIMRYHLVMEALMIQPLREKMFDLPSNITEEDIKAVTDRKEVLTTKDIFDGLIKLSKEKELKPYKGENRMDSNKFNELTVLQKRKESIENILKVIRSSSVTASTGIRPIVIVKTGRTPDDNSGDSIIMPSSVLPDIEGHLQAELNQLTTKTDELLKDLQS